MTQDRSSKLSFSIEESVWLNKGQEIEEVLSMSLDPEITIEERNEHVIIKGGLQLVGEYRTAEKTEEEKSESLKEQMTFRSIEEVSLSEDGIGEVKHYFPIDVTIPLSRINSLDDVYVQVDSFDYDLPEKSCIQLTADISISGMSTNEVEERTTEEVEVPLAEPAQIQETIPPAEEKVVNHTFEFEARKKAVDIPPNVPVPALEEAGSEPPAFPEHPEPAKEKELKKATEPISIVERDGDLQEQQEKVVEEQTPELTLQRREEERPKQTSSVTSMFLNKEERTPRQEEPSPVGEAAARPAETPIVQEEVDARPNEGGTAPVLEDQQAKQLEAKQSEEKVREPEHETKINLSPLKKIAEAPLAAVETEERPPADVAAEKEQEDKPKSRTGENALYLTKMLTNGEEQFSKLKMCIIQENESLDTIAERYEISTSQLLRVNRLDNERVAEGQIIYIPVSSK